ncbi:hypothetical protein M5X02_23975 [Paenibacillus alvei]|uniref:hypothetical protein n=1 Tax=Paenibacillus alvei TaxID=44250 RepID=UPI000289AF41|nr:hypothetical protein [Paenibacillus alvei]EJW14833.1 hypothetical protein PAV_11c01740 [Paenibacillus alvei DSM 29]MCY7487931.1 hypothetical protein [Paenibacillus alvei]MCY9543699.1 hypothetical protein [Paenibacillus alvei]MCY9708537.1 hypothetical protein [Paenibacillus alvei]MEC0083238.1 hypothetical protein [Paenibacillus alvei]
MPKRNYAAEIIELLHEAMNEYEAAKEGQSRCELEYNDINHALELLEMNAVELVKTAADMKRCRRERRVFKETAELLEPLNQWAETWNKAYIALKQLAQETDKTIRKMERRKYTPRVKTELTSRFHKEGKR